MRISDWSSDVCSSDLGTTCGHGRHDPRPAPPASMGSGRRLACGNASVVVPARRAPARLATKLAYAREYGPPYHRRAVALGGWCPRSEEHTSELQSLMRISYAVFCLNKKKKI